MNDEESRDWKVHQWWIFHLKYSNFLIPEFPWKLKEEINHTSTGRRAPTRGIEQRLFALIPYQELTRKEKEAAGKQPSKTYLHDLKFNIQSIELDFKNYLPIFIDYQIPIGLVDLDGFAHH